MALLMQWAGGAVAAAALVLIAWALLWDRARGRRRCPGGWLRGCWYDMSATAGLRCPECGREARRERDLFRTRRRWSLALAGLVVAVAGALVVARPWLSSGKWHQYLPDTVLIALVGRVHDKWVYDEIGERCGAGLTLERLVPPDHFWDWQWRMLARRCGDAVEKEAGPVLRAQALSTLLLHCPEPELGIDGILHAFGDSDWKTRHLAVWGTKACRFELNDHREQIVAAMQSLLRDSNTQVMRDVPLTISMFQSLPEGALPPRARFGATTLTPDQVVQRLTGANSDSLVAVHRELGIWPRQLLWPYNGESGPYAVYRYDLELDGQPGCDAAILVGDQWHTHNEFLIFCRRGDSWNFLGFIIAGNNLGPMPKARVQTTPAGRRLLIITQRGGYTDREVDGWFRIEGDTIKPCLSRYGAVIHHDLSGQASRAPLIADMDWEPRFFDTPDGRIGADVHVHARLTGGISPAWPATPERDLAKDAGVVLDREGTIRFRADSSGVFHFDTSSDWTEDELDMVGFDSPDEFLHRHAARLIPLARTGTDAQKAWLRLFVGLCNDCDAKTQIKESLGAPAGNP
jgi:hypothetical protein